MTGSRETSRSSAAAALWIVLGVGLLARLVLLFVGRITIVDGFYLQNAFLLGRGATPYQDFVHVAFPVVEWIYALPVAASDGDARIAVASLLSGACVLATGGFLAALCSRFAGRLAAVAAGLGYVLAAPVIAFHQFERELWTNLGLAVAAWLLFASRSERREARAALTGLVLAVTLTFKLTSAIGAAALLVALCVRGRPREALIAGSSLTLSFVAVSLLCLARYGDEFLTQVFLFYFFKGEAGTVVGRMEMLARHVDPNLLLGGLGIAAAGWAAFANRTGREPRGPLLAVATCLLVAWLAHYAFVSPSFWDHNALDLALPAALGVGLLFERLNAPGRRRWLIAALLLGVGAGLRGIGAERPMWFPHGLGGPTPSATLTRQADALRQSSVWGDLVVSPSPIATFVAGRRPFVSDFELEPVARGLLREWRDRGLLPTLARRSEGVFLGAPLGQPSRDSAQNLFHDRVVGNTMLHIVPRLIDAVTHRELAVLIVPTALGLDEHLARAGYRVTGRGAARAHVRPEDQE